MWIYVSWMVYGRAFGLTTVDTWAGYFYVAGTALCIVGC